MSATEEDETLRSSRPETGQMKFKGDWTGFFIRGDNALLQYAPALSRLLQKNAPYEPDRPPSIQEVFDRAVIENLVEMLSYCDESKAKDDPDVQRMRPFLDCIE